LVGIIIIIIKAVAKLAEGLNQSNEKSDRKKEGIEHTKAKLGETLKKWESKVIHGRYIRSMDRELISKEDVFQ
jgi:hypothetical protein